MSMYDAFLSLGAVGEAQSDHVGDALSPFDSNLLSPEAPSVKKAAIADMTGPVLALKNRRAWLCKRKQVIPHSHLQHACMLALIS